MTRRGRSSNKHHDIILDKEADRIIKVCKEAGLYLSWNQATAIVAKNSELGRRMSIREAKDFILKLDSEKLNKRLFS